MSGTKFDADNLKEKIEVLDGSRASQKNRAAVRIEDLEQILQIADLKTKTLTAAPTMTDFNSLLADLRMINNQLQAVGKALQGRLLK